jgi:hypothetical protein
MQELLEKLQMSPAELQQQADLMHQYYSTPAEEAPNSVYYDDEICEVLLCRQVLLEYVEAIFAAATSPVPGQ